MCRFIAYTGQPILLDEVLFKPKNSLIRQSVHARETSEPLNGDGFGLGWYMVNSQDERPGLFVSTQPAWNDQNLLHISSKIKSGCFFAHVRAASHGGISKYNCHPFQYKQLLFMHNGGISGFKMIKRLIRRRLSDHIYDWVQGQTDSEHFFALLLQIIEDKNLANNVDDFALALEEAILLVREIQRDQHVEQASHINCVITDGKNMVAIRYLLNPMGISDQARTLYYATGSELKTTAGICRIYDSNKKQNAALIVSEKLDNHRADWQLVPENHLLQISDDYTIRLRPVAV